MVNHPSIDAYRSTFLPPGPGEWRIIDHIAHPGTLCFAGYYYEPMETGWNEEAELIGTLNRVKIREVNGFMYYQMGGLETEQEFSRMCKVNEGYWEEKRYLARLREWDEVVKPDSARQLLALQNTKLDRLSTGELIKHIEHCFRVTKEMVKNHHRFTYTAFIPVGDFVRQVSSWTGRDLVDVLDALKGNNPGKLFMAFQIDCVQGLLEEFQKNTIAAYLLSKADREPENAGEILNELLAFGGRIEQGLRYILENFGYRIVNGYDITVETLIERPDLLLKALKAVLYTRLSHDPKGLRSLRDRTPDQGKPLFDELLGDAREMQRLRDERGMYSDLWAIGILRHAILEAGRRLAHQGSIASSTLALDASLEELITLLEKDRGISSKELQQRAAYRSRYSVTDSPATLGKPLADPPDPSPLPPSMARTMAGLVTALTLAVEHTPMEAQQQDTVMGTPASKGIVEGTVRVILSEEQIQDIKRGDILVVHQTTAAFNVVFPLIGGLISQFGGILSHPAILAREYGIPCVVGCTEARKYLRTGMRIRLDANKGEVRIVQKDEGFIQKLESLRCEYRGPLQGRNRDRVFNHLGAVSEKLRILEKIRNDEKCSTSLHRHFDAEISAEEAAGQIIRQLKKSSIEISRGTLEGFVQRQHVEFHPCDACNLRCSGCTYFQDTPSRPEALSFPFDHVSKICSLLQPKAVTIVGGGEPALYASDQHRLGDLICALGQGQFGSSPALGLISSGVQWPAGNPTWPDSLEWVRYSLDASTPDSYLRSKGRDYFEKIVENIFRTLTQTDIPQVGVGFLYHPGNIAEAGQLISDLAQRLRRVCPDQLSRLNIQFRPWRMPVGRPSIQETILSQEDIERASVALLSYTEQDDYVRQFARQNTNIAVNLLCGGARQGVKPFSDCFFGLAKSVVRADGSMYPCFRMAATRDPLFNCGNILMDTPLIIALKELYVLLFSVRQICTPEYDKCLFCVFNNALEAGLTNKVQPSPDLAGDYFF